jgi:hypothetical protein
MNTTKKSFCSSNHEIIRLGDEIYNIIKNNGYDCQDSIVSLDRINHFVDGIVKDSRGEISKDCYCDRCGNPK